MNADVALVSSAFRAPPVNVEAEKSLLGAVMMNNRALERVTDYLRPEHFADPANARIFDAICKLVDQGKQASPVTLKSYLAADDIVGAAGGMDYIAALSASVVTIINTADYGRLIYDLHLRRELIAFGDNTINDAFDQASGDSAVDIIERREAELFNLVSSGQVEDRMTSLDGAVTAALSQAEAAYKRDGALTGVTTGLRDMDKALGGLHASDLLILAGRPSMGKTALATRMAFNAAKYFHTTDRAEDRGKKVVFFSLEMSAEQLGTRIVAAQSGIDSHRIRTGRITADEYSKMIGAQREIAELPLMIDDTPAVTVAQVRARCRRIARQKRAPGAEGSALGAIVIDYLQLMGGDRNQRGENRVQEISGITRGLKALAKELNVPVLALSQLSRAVEAREDKRPQLADLRESGSIEQDADVVMFVYRAEYYLERAEPQQRPEESDDKFTDRHQKWDEALQRAHNIAEAIIAKQRHGPITTVRLHFDPALTEFTDLERNTGPGAPNAGADPNDQWWDPK